MSYMHVVSGDTCIPYVHMDFKTVLNTLVFKQVMRNRIVDSSKIALKYGDEFRIFES